MKIIEGFPSTSMNNYQLNTSTLIRHAVRCYADQEIVYRTAEGLKRYTYNDAYERIMRAANCLEKLGIKPGDRVGVLDWNSNRHFELYFSISGTGAVFLQMNLRLSPNDLSYVTNHAEAKLVFVDESLLPIAEAIAPSLETVEGYIVMTGKPLSEIRTSLSPVYHYEDLLKESDPVYDWPMINEDSAYSACYTSGTTGRPKGVYYSHRDIYLHTMVMVSYVGLHCDDCVMNIVPLFHGQGWGVFFGAVMMGAKMIFPGRYVAEDTSPLVDIMIQEKVTVANGAPAIFLPMLHYIETLEQKPDFSRARFLSGATEPPLAMMKGFKELTGAEVIHAYGATETTPLVTINYHIKPTLREKLTDEERWDLKRKQGMIATGLDVVVCDEDGNELPWDGNTIGEICVRGPWITEKYYNSPGSEWQFRNDYWRSGDAGTIDPNGYVKVVDRFKDVIKSGGEWISSVDLENEIMGHPGVFEAVVVGLPHPKWQERPLALVVCKKNQNITSDEIYDLLSKRFARWQLPDKVLFVNEIPKTSVGKFNKKAIIQQYQELYKENG
jgi:fatty-acyl-CoA synthase